MTVLEKKVSKLERMVRSLTSANSIKDDKYHIIHRGQVILTYDENPQEKIEDLSARLEVRQRLLSSLNQSLADAQLEKHLEEGDHAQLRSDFRRASREKDRIKADFNDVDREATKLEEKLDEANMTIAKFKSSCPVSGVGALEHFKLGLLKLFRR